MWRSRPTRSLWRRLVPASLYDGIALNLYTNALKAVTAKTGADRGLIAMRSWNEGRWHYLEVSDNWRGHSRTPASPGFSIPLFTTTEFAERPTGLRDGLRVGARAPGRGGIRGAADLDSAAARLRHLRPCPPSDLRGPSDERTPNPASC